MSKLRAGILGIGNIAHRHARAIAALEDRVELVALCTRNQANARAFAGQYTAARSRKRAVLFSSHAEMFERANLDLAIICLPPFAHTDEVERAAERGIHLLVEKPIALDSETAWNMVRAAERAHIKTQVGFVYRFGEAVEQLKTRLDSGSTGRAGFMSARFFANALNAPWWRERNKSGGQLVEQTIHLFDLFRYLVGEPARVYARQANLFHRDLPDYTVEDVNAAILETADGALGVIYATNAAVPDKWEKEWHVICQTLLAEFSDWNHATFTPTTAPALASQTISSDRDVFTAQLGDLLHAIETDGETRTPLREGARSLDLVLAAAQSGARGVPIEPVPPPK